MTASRAYRFWAVAGGLCTAALLMLIVVPAIRDFQRGQQRSANRDRLKQILLALHAYEEQHSSLPPAYVAGPDGRRWHSWRAIILPQLGEEKLAAAYRWDEPWDGPNNRLLSARRPEVFSSRDAQHETDEQANFRAVVSGVSMWPEQYAMRFSDVTDGLANTICLINDAGSRASWLEPNDLSLDDCVKLLDLLDDEQDRVLAGMGDGTIRFISRSIDRETWRKLLTASSGAPFRGIDFPISSDLLNRPLPALVDASGLKGVTISSHEDVPIGTDTIVACAAFPLAWKALEDRLERRPLTVTGSGIGEQLSNSLLGRASLDPETVVAVAGRMNDRSEVEQARSAMAKLIPGARPVLSGASPAAVFAVAAISKNLLFRHPFDVIREPLEFRGGDTARVRAFGIEHVETRSHVSPFDSQVFVSDYAGRDDYILKLITTGPRRDEIVLAKIPPQATLGDTWRAVEKRLAVPSMKNVARLRAGETVQIPCLALGASSRFAELEGRSVGGGDYELSVARQDLQLLLDEYGAWMVATSEVIGENGHDTPDDQNAIRSFRFDRPFLVAMKEPESASPYFLAWIANAALMTRK
ncbi:MAG TPA: DUF1559 domain-containing protein [Caulifigura sp.]|nr:DUF1559 domain-containing protein [Caulifigura sp.]